MTRQRVVLAHGWLGSHRQVALLGRAIAAAGFDVDYLRYRSLFGGFDAAVQAALRIVEAERGVPVHLVGFSLGGLVLRATAAAMSGDPTSILLIGVPNAGSRFADIVGKVFPTPALRRLSTGARRLPEPPARVRVGCIAGDRRGIIGRLLKGRNDSRVTVASALAVRHDEAYIVAAKHRTLHRDAETLRLAVRFLARPS